MSDLPALSYCRPRDLDEAASALARPGACIYAGGTDLVVALGERRPWVAFVREIVDIKGLDVARGIRATGDALRIGALSTTAELMANALVRRRATALAEAAAATGAPALRRRGTIGGNLTTPHPAGDVTTALLALGATIDVVDGLDRREVPIAEFMTAQAAVWPRQRLIVAVTVPWCRRSAFEKVGLRGSFSRSLAAVGVAVHGRRTTVAYGGLRERPFVATTIETGISSDGSVAAALAAERLAQHDPYRVRLADVLLGRALDRVRRR